MTKVFQAYMAYKSKRWNPLLTATPCAENSSRIRWHVMRVFEMRTHGLAADYQLAISPFARSAIPASVVLVGNKQ